MALGLPPIRRFITGFGENGKSRIIENEAMEGRTMPERPGFRMANIWATTSTPAPIRRRRRQASSTACIRRRTARSFA